MLVLSEGFKACWSLRRIQGTLVYYLSEGFKARWSTTLAKDSRHAGLLPSEGFKARWSTTLVKDSRHAGLLP